MTREKCTHVYNRGERHLSIINIKTEDTDLKGCPWSSLIFSILVKLITDAIGKVSNFAPITYFTNCMNSHTVSGRSYVIGVVRT